VSIHDPLQQQRQITVDLDLEPGFIGGHLIKVREQ